MFRCFSRPLRLVTATYILSVRVCIVYVVRIRLIVRRLMMRTGMRVVGHVIFSFLIGLALIGGRDPGFRIVRGRPICGLYVSFVHNLISVYPFRLVAVTILLLGVFCNVFYRTSLYMYCAYASRGRMKVAIVRRINTFVAMSIRYLVRYVYFLFVLCSFSSTIRCRIRNSTSRRTY